MSKQTFKIFSCRLEWLILFTVLVVQPAKAQDIPKFDLFVNRLRPAKTIQEAKPPQATRKIRQLSQIEPVITSAQMLLVQSPTPNNLPNQGSEVVLVTGVKANPTNQGVEIILQTTKGQQLQVINRSIGNSFIADVPNAQLRLLSGEAFTFRSTKPIAGITEITVSNFDASTIRVTVIGEASVPAVELSDSPDEGLIFSVASAASTQNRTPPAPGSQQTQPEQPTAQDDQPIELVVTGEQDTRYNAPDASTATKTDTPLRDIPGSIQVIPQEVIRDQGAISVREAVRNVSGVTYSSSFGNRGESFTVRGFGAEPFLNGFRGEGFSRTQEESANIDRIEILKGPASILYGRVDPSGIINRVTKKPLFDPFYELNFTAGSYSFYRPTLDFAGPLNDEKTLAYRLNIAYEDAGSFRDRVQTERFFFAPSFTYQLGKNTSLNLDVSYLRDARPIDRGLVVLSDNKVPNIPIGRYLGDPTRQEKFTQTLAALYLDHRFNPNLSLRSLFRYTASTESGPGATLQIFGDTEDDRTFELGNSIGDQYYETYSWQNDLTAKVKTGAIQHTVLLGLELTRQQSFFSARDRSAGFIDVFNPNYNFTFGEFDPLRTGNDVTETFGIYLQDQITLLDNLKLLVGGRFDTYHYESTTNDVANAPDNADAFTPRVGIVYQPIQQVSLYTSYSQSFTPNSGRSISNQPFDPQRGTGYEVGVKTELLNGRLSSTLAYYDTKLKNVLTDDLDNPGYSLQVGEQRSRGIEFDIAGEILPGWKVIASYANTNAEITKDNTFAIGNRLNNVPRNGGSLWTTYTLQTGSLKGLGVGFGAFFVGERAGDLENSFVLPSYTRLDAALYYQKDNLRIGLNFKNLSDIRYFEGSQGRVQVIPGAPFIVQGTISYSF
ncbi:TonB-dependent siderophore receptor [Nostoc sp. PA-18-2419]|uniref:TonB-dependent siderophore receptor n=1 Tax=Nostoc sp. PA-18-2419 TaxID=2575443 RepID=UPI001107CA94|nr:TonB-dependent siderophore receptor [Nostoc sp. PA-18-2419]